MQRYLRFGNLTLIAAGLLLVVGGMVYCATWTTPFSAETLTTGFIAAAAVRLFGVIGLMIGLTALVVRQSDRSGTLGLVALVGVMAWLTLWAGTIFTDLFVSGLLSRSVPDVVDGTASDDRMGVGFLVAYFGVVMLILLGIATLRAHVFSRSVGWLLIATGIVAIVPLPIDLPVSDIVLGALLALVGCFASRTMLARPGSSHAAQEVVNAA